jgi:hypothetical protein
VPLLWARVRYIQVGRQCDHGSRLPPLNRASRERSTTSALRSTCGRMCVVCAPGASSSAVVVTGWVVSPVLRPRRTARTGPVPRLQHEARAGSARHCEGDRQQGKGEERADEPCQRCRRKSRRGRSSRTSKRSAAANIYAVSIAGALAVSCRSNIPGTCCTPARRARRPFASRHHRP